MSEWNPNMGQPIEGFVVPNFFNEKKLKVNYQLFDVFKNFFAFT